MHEGALCQEIMDVAKRAAKRYGLKKIYEIFVVTGPYSGVHEGQLNFYFDVAKKGTCMEDGLISLLLDESLKGANQLYVKNITGE